MSTARAEWVSAPTEMASTPAAASSAMRGSVTPPDTHDGAPARNAHALGHVLGAHVVEEDDVRAASSARQLDQRVDLALHARGCGRAPGRGAPPAHAAGREHVVVR